MIRRSDDQKMKCNSLSLGEGRGEGLGEFLSGRFFGCKSSPNMKEVRFATLSLGEGLGVRLRAFRLRSLRRSCEGCASELLVLQWDLAAITFHEMYS